MNKAILSFCLLVCLCSAGSAFAGSHLWVVNEVYSNADGTIQFVEMWNASAANEINLAGKSVTADQTGSAHTFTSNLPPNSTSNKHILLATAGFAAMPGAPTPDHIVPDNFFSTTADTLQFHVYVPSILSFAAGELPLDGVNSYSQNGTTGPATPQNFAGDSWSAPPGVDDGSNGTPLIVEKILVDASRLRVTFSDQSCLGAAGYHIVFADGSKLPSAPGQPFGMTGGRCGVASSPATWTGVPDPASDPTRLLWFLVVADDAAMTEGSMGAGSDGLERAGPGVGGASTICSMMIKDASNSCR